MRARAPTALTFVFLVAAHASIFTIAAGSASAASDVGFGRSVLGGTSSVNPTTLQFGPDGRLYVGQYDGKIKAYTIARDGRDDYRLTATETIKNVSKIPNHDDDGTLRSDVTGRLVTGLLVAGSATRPVLYVSSSDPRFGGGVTGGGDSGLDTNSGVISKVRWNGAKWIRSDLVRGLPRRCEWTRALRRRWRDTCAGGSHRSSCCRGGSRSSRRRRRGCVSR